MAKKTLTGFDGINTAVCDLVFAAIAKCPTIKCPKVGITAPSLQDMSLIIGEDFIAVHGVNDSMLRKYSIFALVEEWDRADYGDYVLYNIRDSNVGKFHLSARAET